MRRFRSLLDHLVTRLMAMEQIPRLSNYGASLSSADVCIHGWGRRKGSPDKAFLLAKRSAGSVANRQDPDADGNLVSNIISGEARLLP